MSGSFPEFIKRPLNRVPPTNQNTDDIEGYYYTANDGSQFACWESASDRKSKKHRHPFDEYMICISGQYTVFINNQTIVLNPGDELLIPANTEQWGRSTAGTRTLHFFGGKRIINEI